MPSMGPNEFDMVLDMVGSYIIRPGSKSTRGQLSPSSEIGRKISNS